MARAENPNAYDIGGIVTVPAFNSIDQNGVDLASGMLRVRSPVMTMGSGDDAYVYGLEWTGQAWRHIGLPNVSRDGSKYYVSFEGQTYEFNDYGSNWSERKPVRGASLECSVTLPSKYVDFCIFIGRHGQIVQFHGYPEFTPKSNFLGYEAMALGNLGIPGAALHGTHSSGQWLDYGLLEEYRGNGFDVGYNQHEQIFRMREQSLKLTTSNHNGGNNSEHYLRPKNATQIFTDDFGQQWKFITNGDREISSIQRPGGLATISYTYDGDHRVDQITTPDGVWDYNFSTSGNIRTALVMAPNGRQVRVKSHKDLGYVTEYAEGQLGTSSEKKTTYTYNADERLVQITYPELNYDTFEYDARGNVIKKQSYPKPSSGEAVLTWTVTFPATCTNRVTCNSPISATDPEGNVTDFEYAATGGKHLTRLGSTVVVKSNVDVGEFQPSKVIYPAAQSGAPRRAVSYEYRRGKVSRTSTCISTASCAGTADEVVTETKFVAVPTNVSVKTAMGSYAVITDNFLVPVEEAVTANGQVRRSCNVIDTFGRVVSTIPASANPASCSTTLVTPQSTTANSPVANPARTAPTFSQ